jgi:hypothetical protein
VIVIRIVEAVFGAKKQARYDKNNAENRQNYFNIHKFPETTKPG